eukprot:CAMPEP_0115426922 /NCGR_PEP_ID=MMETSP0271-20121206/29167_1 /TAXON_ID=71861 /ORGANISM="Scrippsiella trochoidea, Strain CCMP3099" /LENGTH=84 /DNA_ID=CAMNT_0002851911 /DNA_START=134 /DNA_END=387 /DNA_ORIENTATION=-
MEMTPEDPNTMAVDRAARCRVSASRACVVALVYAEEDHELDGIKRHAHGLNIRPLTARRPEKLGYSHARGAKNRTEVDQSAEPL